MNEMKKDLLKRISQSTVYPMAYVTALYNMTDSIDMVVGLLDSATVGDPTAAAVFLNNTKRQSTIRNENNKYKANLLDTMCFWSRLKYAFSGKYVSSIELMFNKPITKKV